jgi:hypothetical protein
MPKKQNSKDIIAAVENRLAEGRKHYKTRVGERLDNLVYWISLVLLALFNLIACFFLIPFLILFEGWKVYLAVAGFGFMFGFLFNLLILGIEHLEQRHSLVAGIFIPLLAVIDISVILNITEKLGKIFVKQPTYSTSLVIVIFISAFIVPYVFAVLTGRHKL